jgi:hypothetical protein
MHPAQSNYADADSRWPEALSVELPVLGHDAEVSDDH